MRRMIEIPRPELDTKPPLPEDPQKNSLFFLIESCQIMRFFSRSI